MKILITGASGFIGRQLAIYLAKQNHQIAVVGRQVKKLQRCFEHYSFDSYSWDDLTTKRLACYDCIIHLAGENIATKRWSESRKNQIIESRVTTTYQLATLLAAIGADAPHLLCASAIGIYGSHTNHLAEPIKTIYTEQSTLPEPPKDFLSLVAHLWEQALTPAIQANVPVTKLRFGIVIGKQGGTLGKLLLPFQCGFGMILGTGKQLLSWISLYDVCRAISFLMLNHKVGTYNLVADEIVTQKQFAKTLAQVLNRPCFFHMPKIIVKCLFGQMGEALLLSGQAVKAAALTELGFTCTHKDLKSALIHACHSRQGEEQL